MQTSLKTLKKSMYVKFFQRSITHYRQPLDKEQSDAQYTHEKTDIRID